LMSNELREDVILFYNEKKRRNRRRRTLKSIKYDWV